MNNLIRRNDAIKAACKGADYWDGGCSSDRDEYIEEEINNIPAIEPNLLIAPETIERGCETYIGENIVVVHHDDFMDMKCKAMSWDDYQEQMNFDDDFISLKAVHNLVFNNGWAFDEPQWQVEFWSMVADLPRRTIKDE